MISERSGQHVTSTQGQPSVKVVERTLGPYLDLTLTHTQPQPQLTPTPTRTGTLTLTLTEP